MKEPKQPPQPGRRDFVRSCVGIMALSLPQRARSGQLDAGKSYPRARLMDRDGRPFKAGDLGTAETYLFHYPFRTTPCFLIDLGQPVDPVDALHTRSGRSYRWPGGVGPESSIVAFSAICAHKMTHPAKSVSFINYRPEKIQYMNNDKERAQGRHLIYCCSERSVYDVRDGARVLGGPADQPLAAIGLDYDPQMDSLHATGTFGGEMFDRFFAAFTTRLQLEYETTDVGAGVGGATVVQHIDEFSDKRIMC